ncbi:MAG TPA: sigma-54-dependent Fis family transcriptional regulator [Clostridiales bacterium UBA8960]|nr:sigma-54-dependent Fis family transcriptional regulator [Clostridiales bacterium UBA8960]
MVVVDKEGHIILMNEPYCTFLGFKVKDVIGKHVTEIIENTRMHIVVKTGEREIGDVQQIKGNQMIADRVPIYKDGELIGAVGSVIFKDIVELDSYVKRVSTMEKELDFYKKELKKALGSRFTFDNIIGNSSSIEKAKEMAVKVSMSKSSILLLGESGTGKELFAHSIHNSSPRNNYPLIKVNCASIPSELLESELFGYEAGAFTGASKNGKPGKFELADNSTIFLDEIGDLPLSMQAKLLRALQEREIERIGGTKSKKLDVRIIAATNKNLEDMVKQKLFREDLYYRLNVIRITIPSLRDRRTDIPLLAHYLLKKLSKDMDRFVTDISDDAMKLLIAFDWPGNIRELENTIERAINLVNKEAIINVNHLPYYLREQNSDVSGLIHGEGLRDLVAQLEIKEIKNALEVCDQNKQQAAKYLGISRPNLYEKMSKYGL